MQFIDERGRLFGRVNIFDLVVILMLAAAAVFAFKWIKTAEDPSWVKVKMMNITCVGSLEMPNRNALSKGIPSYMADLVNAGDEAFDQEGVVVGRVGKVLSNEPVKGPVYSSKDGDKIFFDPDARELRVEISILTFERKGEVYAAATNLPLRVGSNILLNTKKYSVVVNIQDILKGGV